MQEIKDSLDRVEAKQDSLQKQINEATQERRTATKERQDMLKEIHDLIGTHDESSKALRESIGELTEAIQGLSKRDEHHDADLERLKDFMHREIKAKLKGRVAPVAAGVSGVFTLLIELFKYLNAV